MKKILSITLVLLFSTLSFAELNSTNKVNLNSDLELSCDRYVARTYGWGGGRYDSAEQLTCAAAKKEAISNCLYSEGFRGTKSCRSNSSCIVIACRTFFIARTYGWGGSRYDSREQSSCAAAKKEAVNNCLYSEGFRGTKACRSNSSCVELTE